MVVSGKLLLVIFSLLVVSVAFVWQKKIDSTGYDTTRINRLNNRAYSLVNSDPDSTILLATQAATLAQKNKFYHGETKAYYYIGLGLWLQGNNDKAMDYYNKALKILDSIPHRKSATEFKMMAVCLNGIGNIHYGKGNYGQALEYYFKSLQIKEETGDRTGMATTYGNIGTIHAFKGDYNRAVEFYFKALKIDEDTNNKQGMADSYTSLAIIHTEKAEQRGTMDTVASDYTKALEFHFKALSLEKEVGDKRSMASSYNGIGGLYAMNGDYDHALEFFLNAVQIKKDIHDTLNLHYVRMLCNIGEIFFIKNDWDKAMEEYLKSMKICVVLGDKQGMSFCYSCIGNLYLKQGKVEDAKKQQLLSLAIAKEIEAKVEIYKAYNALSECDSALGNFQNAYKYHTLYLQTKDSVFNEESSKQITEMQTRYETEKKEKEIILQKAELIKKEATIKQQNTQRIAFASAFVLMLVLAGIILRAYRNKQKANKIISAQKKEVELQKEIIEEKNRDITDSVEYASYLQKAILPTDEEFKTLFPESFLLYKPKDIVSGDFYWLTQLNGDKYLLTGDCTGHGVPGAFMSMLCTALLNDAVNNKGLTGPDEILNEVRHGIIAALKQHGKSEDVKDGMDCSLILLTPRPPLLNERGGRFSSLKEENIGGVDLPSPLRQRRIRPLAEGEGLGVRCMIACANNPVYIVRKDELTEIKADRQPVGFSYNPAPFTAQEIELEKGDMMYLMTDGYEDQMGGDSQSLLRKVSMTPQGESFGQLGLSRTQGREGRGRGGTGKKFKSKRVKELLISIAGEPVEKQKEIIEKTFIEWKGNLEQTDDVTIIGIRI